MIFRLARAASAISRAIGAGVIYDQAFGHFAGKKREKRHEQ
ncbi:hypothetical protein HY17_02330 [Hyphomonas sp. CY54-11-8]|nr:hypothetical protein HY17_02330 [Hyphomonas sp. CY54-11-8]RAN38579.1 hypothetical protein HY26_03925 [Hyphomonas sp. GM-8P]